MFVLPKRQSAAGKPCACGCEIILLVGQISSCHNCGINSHNTPANQISSQCRSKNIHCLSCRNIAVVDNPAQVEKIDVANSKRKPNRVKVVKNLDVALPDKAVLVENDKVPVPTQNGVMASDMVESIQKKKKRKTGNKLNKEISNKLTVPVVENPISIGVEIDLPEHGEGEVKLSDAEIPIEKDTTPIKVAEPVGQKIASLDIVVPNELVEQLEEVLIDEENEVEVIVNIPGEENESGALEVSTLGDDVNMNKGAPHEEEIEVNKSVDDEDVIIINEEFIEIYEGSSPGLRGRILDTNDTIRELAKQFLLQDGRLKLHWGCGEIEIISPDEFQTMCQNRYTRT